MAFPSSPTNGQQATVGNVTYQYSSTENSWTRLGGSVPTLSVAGNVSGGNVYSLGVVSATGNVTGNYIIGNGSQLTGLPTGYSNADVATYLASGTDSSNIVTTANISGSYIIGNGSQLTGLPAGYANSNVASYLASGSLSTDIVSTGNISTTGNIVGGNIVTAGTGGNISGANYILGNVVSVTGNVTGNYIIGNGSQLTGLPAGYANSDVAAYLASGTDSSNIITTANISGNYILGNGALLTGVITSVANINNGTSNVTVGIADGNVTVGVSGVGNVAVFTPTGVSVTGAISSTGNIVGGGVRTTTAASAPTSPAPAVGDMWFNTSDNATYRYTYDGTSYFWEDFTGGSITANTSAIINGTSSVQVTANSNVTVGITGTTRATFASDALYITGNILPTSNNVFSLGSPTAAWASVYLSANTLYLGTTPISANAASNTLTVGGNTVVTANPTGTSSTTGNVQVVGNVTGSNLLSGGVVSATGGIAGAFGTLIANLSVGFNEVDYNNTLDSNGISTVGITVGGTATLPGTDSSFASRVTNIAESANIIASAPGATTNFYLNNGAVQYYTANATANITLNFAFSSSTSLNTAMSVGDSVSTTLILTNGATAYMPTVFQVDSANVTPKWQGGTAPSSGDASALDIYNFVIIKTASATYAVLGSQTKFA